MPAPLRLIIRSITIIIILILGLRFFAQPAEEHAWFSQFNSTERPLVIAHADDSGTSPWPGDTLLFLENVAAMNVDVLEMNVNMSSDGEIVLIHDATVDDTTEGTGKISEMTLAEIQSLDAAYDWSQDDGATYPLRDRGIRIPTLKSVFEAYPDYPMVIEMKQTTPAMNGPLCSLIRSYAMENHVIVASFSDTTIQAFREECPEVATASASDETRQFVILNLAFLTNPVAPKYQAFQVPLENSGITVVTPGFISAAHRQNISVQPWTINDPEEMKRLIDLGVDAIMTDRPDLLMEILEK